MVFSPTLAARIVDASLIKDTQTDPVRQIIMLDSLVPAPSPQCEFLASSPQCELDSIGARISQQENARNTTPVTRPDASSSSAWHAGKSLWSVATACGSLAMDATDAPISLGYHDLSHFPDTQQIDARNSDRISMEMADRDLDSTGPCISGDMASDALISFDGARNSDRIHTELVDRDLDPTGALISPLISLEEPDDDHDLLNFPLREEVPRLSEVIARNAFRPKVVLFRKQRKKRKREIRSFYSLRSELKLLRSSKDIGRMRKVDT